MVNVWVAGWLRGAVYRGAGPGDPAGPARDGSPEWGAGVGINTTNEATPPTTDTNSPCRVAPPKTLCVREKQNQAETLPAVCATASQTRSVQSHIVPSRCLVFSHNVVSLRAVFAQVVVLVANLRTRENMVSATGLSSQLSPRGRNRICHDSELGDRARLTARTAPRSG